LKQQKLSFVTAEETAGMKNTNDDYYCCLATTNPHFLKYHIYVNTSCASNTGRSFIEVGRLP